MPGKRQSLSESYRVRSMADLRLTLRHGDPTHRYLRGISAWQRGTSDRSSARPPCPQMPQWHPRVAKGVFWPVFGTATLPTGTSEAFSRGEGDLLTGLRHGDHAHKPLSAIPAWQRGHLSTLWHGDPQQNTPVVGARGKTVWNRCQTGLLPMLRLAFGTASPARGLSVASWRGEAVIYWLFVHEMPLFHGH